MSRRYIMNPGRTTKQGQQINIGKHHPDYDAMVNMLTMNAQDLAEESIPPGSTVKVRSEAGEAIFRCQAGKVPPGMIFVPYGPPTCRLMGYTTDGTGMPLSKGWEVELELVAPPEPAGGSPSPSPSAATSEE